MGKYTQEGQGELRCSTCEEDYDQCSSCENAEKQSYEQRKCPESNGTVLASECGVKAVSTKLDSCSKCGYSFVYP